MMKPMFKPSIIIILAFVHLLTLAQIPSGGVSLIKETGINYQKAGAKGTLTAISITDQPFTTGFRYTTGTDITNTWDGQVKFTGIAGIAANDVVLVAFYMIKNFKLSSY